MELPSAHARILLNIKYLFKTKACKTKGTTLYEYLRGFIPK
jgi:hypothetical protein